ncbi:aminophospholipid-translocating P4-type ATPase DNF1 KNAG_0G01830 [Huiozyma naganishii CBS 8797]|uniref:Phospholipid-transporting ATPase n=1 Tax=Huiozyma naganishii (strain ATCC MYA-139 / BCRC 22969 / CBS 8797 / KCTC 17520 / NBRC 10181 / NCYC 3082 / Yp74L-3) TaxID=1071383 RepID=J7S917_HUIN7|nr:hypothetical protein KNAG_0G01830 [Kazachstania naganishii CBS 8797]CCK71241.1 hypothetical protein KNAG_0G01830 [Kazachstania naganishii CBS 8797]
MPIDKTNPFQEDVNPFDSEDEFNFELGDGNRSSQHAKSNDNKVTFDEPRDTRKPHLDESLSFENTADADSFDGHSYQQTPDIGRFNHNESGTFDDIELENDNNAETPAMKRLRLGTQRNKKGKPLIGRTKTLKWAKENLYNPFEDFIKEEDAFDDAGMKNRADELRTVYYNMDLPDDMLDEEGKPLADYARNKIRTTKYTPLTFLPKNILFQFQNFANVYFLMLIILGAFQIFGVTNPGLSAVPLIVIVIITAIKDGVEDSRRTVLDLEVNNTRTHILEGVPNGNISADNVSMWRKFKKANTRLLVKFIDYCKSRFSEEGRRKRAMRQRNHLRVQHARAQGDTDMPRNSLDSVGSYRFSAEYGRPSLDENGADGMANEGHIIDRTLPPRTDCKFSKDFWKNVKVGDIVRIHNNDEIPADVILLASSDNDGACYLETKNLDGETNLKVRQSLSTTLDIRNSRDVARSRFWVESEGPHANLYSYEGNLKYIDTKDGDLKNEPITINNMLLRGCTLRNTKWAMGIVMFTGDETKIMLNAGVTPTKKSRISRELNFSVLINFLILFILCFISAIINGVSYSKHPASRDYFEFGIIGGTASTAGFVTFWVAVILYQSLVPISLYISVEIIKTAQAAFIYGDVLLYNARLDYPCTPKSWNISDDLGQIEYIFSDKTGTLTQNIMEFKKCTINGVSYGRAYTEALAGLRKRQGVDVESESRHEKEGIARDREIMIKDLMHLSDNSQFYPEDITFVSKEFTDDLKAKNGEVQQKCCQHFMLALALCHSVLVEKNKVDPNRLDIKAQSPDEAALVTTARDMGFSFVGSTKQGMIIEIQGVQKEFQILNILEFNSSRKRMSCIVKIPAANPEEEPKALLICKGADSVIFSRLSTKAGANDEQLLEKTALHLEQYATEGLRTLCIAQKEISWPAYQKWNAKYNAAAAVLTNREEQLDAVADAIERDLILLGGTAIEDRLQDGVPDSIAILVQAGIKLWVLTGDKVETAINIGFSCNLLNNEMELLVIKTSGEDVKEYGTEPSQIVDNLVSTYLREKFGLGGTEMELANAKADHEHPKGNFAVIVDGEALKLLLNDEDMRRKFLLLCKNCRAVLCCRVSPSQKAAVVKLVKNTLDVMTLAIGDGSNDVAMIQSADVGIGIAGEEGRQAVMCSDYAIGQFRYLTRLLLVHGRWSYKRLAEMIPSFFYKNVIFTLTLFWYGIYNNFDGSYLFEYTFIMFYNLAFTSLPVIFLGILDQDVSDTVSLVVPQLYRVGILRLEWKQTKFLWYMLDGLYQSCISFFFPYCVYRKTMIVTKNGLGIDHRYDVGVMVASIAVISCNLHILLHQYRWDWFSVTWIALSCLVLFFWTGIWSSVLHSKDLYKAASRIYDTPAFWAVFFVGVCYCLLPRFTLDCCRKFFYPTDVEIVREMWARGDFDHYPTGYDPTDPDRPKIVKPGKLGEHPVSINSRGIELRDNYGFGSVSQESVLTEEIPMNILNDAAGSPTALRVEENRQTWGDSPKETQDLLFSPRLKDEGKGTFEPQTGSTLRQSTVPQNRTSLDHTREQMLSSNQLDNRYSVERARMSLELPGIKNAEGLLDARKSFHRDR